MAVLLFRAGLRGVRAKIAYDAPARRGKETI